MVLVALQKLKLGRRINPEESSALSYLAEALKLLSQASRLSSATSVPPNLRASFCTLVAIQEATPAQHELPAFDAAGEWLNEIRQKLGSATGSPIAEALLKEAQATCSKLLQHLNQQQPEPAAM
jgi:hypothetical protein